MPVTAHIVGICDAFDAMTRHRHYRAGMPIEKALDILRCEKGAQFDESLSTRFVGLGKAGRLDHVLAHSDEGIPLQSCPMCGPTLVLRRGLVAGQRIYCRNCSGEFELDTSDMGMLAKPTGRRGAASDLEPEADFELIRTIVAATVANPPIRALMDTSSGYA